MSRAQTYEAPLYVPWAPTDEQKAPGVISAVALDAAVVVIDGDVVVVDAAVVGAASDCGTVAGAVVVGATSGGGAVVGSAVVEASS